MIYDELLREYGYGNGENPIPVPDAPTVSLNGKWQVEYRLTGKRCELSMPGKVFYSEPEAESKDIPDFDRVTLSHIDGNDGARMVKKAVIPPEWAKKRIFIHFGAIYPGGDVWCNGRKIMEVRSGLTPEQAEITDLARGRKEVEIRLDLIRRHKFIQMDMARHSMEFAGLAQEAFLFAVEPEHLKDFYLQSVLNDDFSSGVLEGSLTFSGAVAAEIEIFDRKKKIASQSLRGASEYPVRLAVPRPKLWNDEFPHLYTVRITMATGETYSFQTGFRKLELTENGARLNGKFVKFRGVNHLTFHPKYGMYTPKAWLRKDLELMKKANVNTIRTHYSGPVALQELCDEMGFYLLQEIPIDWGTHYIHDPEWVAPALHRIERIVRRDRHHASVMVWSVGNENMPESTAVEKAGWKHLKLYDRFCHVLDPSRPTMFPPPGPANKIEGIFELRVGNIGDIHYNLRPVEKFLKTGSVSNPESWDANHVAMTRQEALSRGWSGCWFSSEWGLFNLIPDLLNAPYGSVIRNQQIDLLSNAGTLQTFQERIDEEWGFMRREASCLGGAFFPWMCASAGKNNPWGWQRLGEDADWGVVCADFTAKPEFWALRHAFSPVYLPSRLVWRKGQKDVNFEVWNQFNQINLNQCTFRVQSESVQIWMTMMRKFFDLTPPDCEPGEKALMHIPLTDEQRRKLDDGKALIFRITMLQPSGFKFGVGEIMILPETLSKSGDSYMPLGPDAVMETR